MKKVLVTGATGFLGQKLALRLHQLGYEVLATGRNTERAEKLIKNRVAFQAADLAKKEDVLSLCLGCDIIFHCAAHSASWGEYQTFYRSNVLATENIVTAALQMGVERLIHVSTPSVSFHHLSDYAKTKKIAEEIVIKGQARGLFTLILRPRALFGPGDKTLLPRIIQTQKKGKLPIINGGRARVDLTYIENAVDALVLCLHADSRHSGKTYAITNGEPMAFIDALSLLFQKIELPLKTKPLPYGFAYYLGWALEKLHRCLGIQREPLITRATATYLGKSETFDITSAKEDLGYSPNISIGEGFEKFAHWWKKEEASLSSPSHL